MTRCPTCASLKTESVSNRNEFICSECDSTFNPVMKKIYTEGSYPKLCGSVATLIAENMLDVRLGTSIREIVEGYVNEDPKDVNLLIERLADIAQDLYNDYKMNRREKYDFGALMEGINRLNEFANIQSPQDDLASEEVPEVSDTTDPMSMVNPAVDGSIEVGEHSALEKLKNAICAVQCAIQSLESAEAQENGAGELNADAGELSALPHEDSVVEGLQSGAIDSPTLNVSGSDPMVTEVPSMSSVPGAEGPEHEQEEQGAIADLKAGLEQLQAAYAEYMGSEEKVHGDVGTDPDNGITSPLSSPDFGDKLNALNAVDGIDRKTFLEKAKELMEDAQLVNQDWLKKDLEKSKDVNTHEIGEETIIEARPNEENIETNKFVKKPVKEEVVDPGTESGEISDQPGEVNPAGVIHTDDISQAFSPENTFKKEDNVLYENKQCVVVAVDGKYLTLHNPKNGHNIEVLAEDVQYANTEDIDIIGERFNESNNTLLAAWEKIEKTINEENLNAPKRSYDLRTNRYTEGF
jgi:hypothetical protein